MKLIKGTRRIYDFIYYYVAKEEYFDNRFLEHLRCMFTTIALMENFESDTALCDITMNKMYNQICNIKPWFNHTMDYEKFYNYMVEYIV